VELRIKKTKKGREYLVPVYAGPIRGAGGTAAAFSLLLTDYMRVIMGYAKYDPDDDEINRFKTEIDDYNSRVTNLQYRPSDDEIGYLVRNLPVEVDGEPTEIFEVSNYKDLPRVNTNRIRGGLCLVLAEGLSQKAPKLWKRLSVWGKDFGLDWGFLEDFLLLQKRKKSKDKGLEQKDKLAPNFTFIDDLVAGRPVLTHPMARGGFRLRYGRSRFSGFSAAGINPATMVLLDNFIATGTQLKMERPGKAASITPCDTIDGPTVITEDGSVVRIKTSREAKLYKERVKEIIFLGDILFNYGDFSENGHVLVPAGYNEDWWLRHLEKASSDMFGSVDAGKISKLTGVGRDIIEGVLEAPFRKGISASHAFRISEKTGIPLHPEYTYYWSHIQNDELAGLVRWLSKGKVYREGSRVTKTVLELEQHAKRTLEKIGVPHSVASNEFVVLDEEHSQGMLASLGLLVTPAGEPVKKIDEGRSVLENVNALSGLKVMDRSGTFVGARMGRPEKAKMRKMTGSPQVLFPIGDEGGRLRSFQAAIEAGKVTADLPMYRCPKCSKDTIFPVCENCGGTTDRLYLCPKCGLSKDASCAHGQGTAYSRQEIDIGHYFQKALDKLGDKVYPDLIKGVRGTMNRDHTPEHMIKGILRAKHEVFVNKDGTVRFDMSELPVTHFKPKEIHTPVEKLKELGYTHDIKGQPLKNEEQIVEIMPQDLILPAATDALDEQAGSVLLKVANFVDELLVKLYGLEPFYNARTRDDMVGQYVIGLAPHISAGTVGRIIGFSNTQGLFAHPLFHAALRRDCDGDEGCVILLMDGLLNFSRQFLPDSRGAKTMDAPLVMTSKLNPAEVDDQVHGLDIVWEYPLELYTAGNAMKNPWEVKIRQLKHTLGTEKQFEKMGFTHDVSNINSGVNFSAYKSLPSMQEKLMGQMAIAERIRAVNESDVARLVIEKHLLRDTKGNLRKFSTQQFRCVKCNEKFRRPPLAGKCGCGGRIIFTVSHGSVIKYLEPTISLANKYEVPVYLKQTLDLLQLRIDSVFGREKEKQEGLGKWFG
jgi:DNA polymerase II large subunit